MACEVIYACVGALALGALIQALLGSSTPAGALASRIHQEPGRRIAGDEKPTSYVEKYFSKEEQSKLWWACGVCSGQILDVAKVALIPY